MTSSQRTKVRGFRDGEEIADVQVCPSCKWIYICDDAPWKCENTDCKFEGKICVGCKIVFKPAPIKKTRGVPVEMSYGDWSIVHKALSYCSETEHKNQCVKMELKEGGTFDTSQVRKVLRKFILLLEGGS